MKRLNKYNVLALLLAVLATACNTDEDVSIYYGLGVDLVFPEGYADTDMSRGSVTAMNTQTGQTYHLDNVASSYEFQLPAGTYTVTVAMRSSNGAMISTFSASQDVSVFDDRYLSLTLEQGTLGGLIFKEVYYNMCRPNGRTPYMRDNFYEVYNNTDETLYLDNCVLGILQGGQGSVPSCWVDADGQLMKKYALEYYTVAFCGSGTDYPVAPGTGVVIACQAQNHIAETAAMYDPSNANAVMSPVDLTNADYEIFLGDYKPAVSIDNPNVPNMTVIYHTGSMNYFNLPYTGNAIILAKLPDTTDPVSFAQDPANFMERPDGIGTTKYMMIPQEYVLDGLNIVNNADRPNQRVVRLRSEVDAGIVFMAKPYGAKSIRRKVESIAPDGRVILKDTNNSTDDFLRDVDPTPGIIPHTVDL